MAEKGQEDVTFKCIVSYFEIYNEKLKDLIAVDNQKEQGSQQPKLDVRYHPKWGTYVPGLTEAATPTYNEVQKTIDFGMKTRTMAATSMNDRSSRSQAQ